MSDRDLQKYIDLQLNLEARNKDRPANQSAAEALALDAGIPKAVLDLARRQAQTLVEEGWAQIEAGHHALAELPLKQAAELQAWHGRCLLGLSLVSFDRYHKTGLPEHGRLTRHYAEKALRLELTADEKAQAEVLLKAKVARKLPPVVPIISIILLLGLGIAVWINESLKNPAPKPVVAAPAPTPLVPQPPRDIPVNKGGDWPSPLDLTAKAVLNTFADSWSVKVTYSTLAVGMALRSLDFVVEVLDKDGQVLDSKRTEFFYGGQPPVLPGETLAGGQLFYRTVTAGQLALPHTVRLQSANYSAFPSPSDGNPWNVNLAADSAVLPEGVALALRWRNLTAAEAVGDSFVYSGLLLVKNTGSKPLAKVNLGLRFRDPATGLLTAWTQWAASTDGPAFAPGEVRPLLVSHSFAASLRAGFTGAQIPLEVRVVEAN